MMETLQASSTLLHSARARNRFSSLVPIHDLPSEIMIRIFELTLYHAQPCSGGANVSPGIHPSYPELLSHVCARWRHIALGSHALWSHIDLVTFPPPKRFKSLLDRNEAFVARAGPKPLELHVVCVHDHSTRRSIEYGRANLLRTSIAARARSLRLVEDPMKVHKSVLGVTLAACSPGILEELMLSGCGVGPSGFFIRPVVHPEPAFGQVNMSEERLEALVLPIKYLDLDGRYFPWTSQAYHGLVELRLEPPHLTPVFSIKPSCFEKILVASPKLRVLIFGLRIGEDRPVRSAPRTPVMLNDLEVLRLRTNGWSQSEAILGFISPGPKLFRVFFDIHTRIDGVVTPPSNDLSRFCERSNVTELCIKCRFRCTLGTIVELIRLSPRLRALTLTNFHGAPGIGDFWNNYQSLFSAAGATPLPVGSRLDRLNLFHCRVSPSDLEGICMALPIHTLGIELSTWEVYVNKLEEIAHGRLSRIFGVVKPIIGEGFSQYWNPSELDDNNRGSIA